MTNVMLLAAFKERICIFRQQRKTFSEDDKKKNNIEQKQLAMVFSAIEDVVRTRRQGRQNESNTDGAELDFEISPAECFAATMTAIESSDGQYLSELFNILSITLPAIPKAVLAQKWQVMADALFQMTQVAAKLELQEASEGKQSSRLSRWLVVCVSNFLKASLHANIKGNKAASTRLHDLLLSATVDPRPKVRRMAQDGLIELIQVGQLTKESPLALGHGYNFYTRVLKASCLNLGKAGQLSSDGKILTVDGKGMMQTLGFFKRFLPLVPVERLIPLCKVVMSVPNLGQPALTHAALRTMETMLQAHVTVGLKKTASLSSSQHGITISAPVQQARVKLLRLIVVATIGMQPDHRELVAMEAFLGLIGTSFVLLYHTDPIEAMLVLPKISALLCDAYKLVRQEVVLKALATTSSKVFTSFLNSSSWRQHVQFSTTSAQSSGNCLIDPDNSTPPVSKAIAAVFGFVHDPVYMPVWSYTLPVVCAVLQTIVPLTTGASATAVPGVASTPQQQAFQASSDKVLLPLVKRTTQVLEAVHNADAADTDQSATSKVALQLLAAVLLAGVNCIGLQNLLKICPLDGNDIEKGPSVQQGVAHAREWLLKFLRGQLGSMLRKPLRLFQEYFLPVAVQCSALSKEKKQAGELAYAQHYRFLTIRVWSLLPHCASHPLQTNNLLAAFPKLAPVLYGAAIDTNYPELSSIVCQTLVNLISPYVEENFRRFEVHQESQQNSEKQVNIQSVANSIPPEEAKVVRNMFQKFSFKFVPLLFRQYDQLHGKWQDTSLEQPVTSTVIIETQNDVKAPVPPPMPQSSLQLPAGGIGEGGSAERLAIMLEAATTYVAISGPTMVEKFTKTLLSRLAKAQLPPTADEFKANPGLRIVNVRQTCVLLGLAQALIPSVKRSQLQLLFRALKMIMSLDAAKLIHTRCFAVVETICKREQHVSVVTNSNGDGDPLLADLVDLLKDALVSVAPKIKRRRLRCLRSLIERGGVNLLTQSAISSAAKSKSKSKSAAAVSGSLSEDEDDSDEAPQHSQVTPGKAWLVGLVGEVVLCTKESNSRAREAAFELLTAMGSSSLKEGGTAAFVDLLTMVSATLAGRTPHMKSAGVIALSRLYYEFKTEEAMQRHGVALLRTVLLLLREKSRELVKSVIGFVKVAVSSMPEASLRQELPHVIQGLLLWAGESKNRFRLKVRTIFERLVAKFGGETILELVPTSDRALVNHIVKMKERIKQVKIKDKTKPKSKHTSSKRAAVEAAVRAQFSRKRSSRALDMRHIDDASEDEQNSVDTSPGKRSRVGSQAQRKEISSAQWIRDDDGAAATDMDLLNTASMVRRLRTSQPHQQLAQEEGNDAGFSFTSDGKLIVPGDATSKRNEEDDVMESAFDSWTKQSRQTGGVRGANRALATKRRNQRKDGRSQRDGGDRFKAKRASGDIKKKGSLEPYAYIKLDSRFTTKKGQKDNLARFAKHRNPKGGKRKRNNLGSHKTR